MALVLMLILLVLIFSLIPRKQDSWIRHGILKRRARLTVNTHTYYLEEVEFDSYQEGLNKYYKIVADIAAYSKILEEKYDLYDWSFSIYRFEDTTVEVRHLRSLHCVRLIKSEKPLSIEDFEMDNPGLIAH